VNREAYLVLLCRNGVPATC